MTDIEILNILNKYKFIPWSRLNNTIKEYLLNRFQDSESLLESYLRIKFNIENRPTCKYCGKKVNITRNKFQPIFHTYCSTKCMTNDIDTKEKISNTCLSKYGVSKFVLSEKYKQENKETIRKKYGVDYIVQSKEIINKINNSKVINKSFNKSKPEEYSYILLKEKFPDIIRQYKSNLYPFRCDFYIPSLDLYIECQYSWVHQYHPFDKNNQQDINKLNKYKLKNTKYYNNVINIWTIRDPLKRKIVKENNLNLIEFWNINELETWLNNQ